MTFSLVSLASLARGNENAIFHFSVYWTTGGRDFFVKHVRLFRWHDVMAEMVIKSKLVWSRSVWITTCPLIPIRFMLVYNIVFFSTVATGKLLQNFSKWYYNMCGFNKIGKSWIMFLIAELQSITNYTHFKAAVCQTFLWFRKSELLWLTNSHVINLG